MAVPRVSVRDIQGPIRQRLAEEGDRSVVCLGVRSAGSDLADPLHCRVSPDSVPGVSWESGAHSAVGGEGDAPCSADLLLGALAACQEITLRMVAANMGVELEELEVTVEGDWDPRGTLAMGKEFPVGLTGVRCHSRIVVKESGGDGAHERSERLLKSAERYCVVLSTLRNGVPVESAFDVRPSGG
jgi:uncharacterized OsmC-like protein